MAYGIAYVDEVQPDGWLTVRIENIGNYEIPEGIKVDITDEKDERQYFRILEGKFRSNKASVRMESYLWGLYTSSYLTTTDRRTRSGANITFKKGSEKLLIDGLGEFNAITSEDNPIPNGVHDIEIPDEIHPHGAGYLSKSQYAKTWFRVGKSGDRYLHCGRISAGCITVKDIERWNEIYKFLIYRRISDTAVSKVTVVD